MASMTITSSFLGGSAAIAVTKQPSTATSRPGLVMMANASKMSKVEKVILDENKEENNTNGRRNMMFAVAAAAALSLANVALAADEEPKRGTEAAKKKYAQVCVTMPTARICRN
ncbi:photosystem II 5 kDa protein, chloroplastic-like [Rutidosis leptorrhynchoides]|uniref:photosystem II 5 kDa protein, chloroplastic-like n=1 Tax=Rutidosis leptorrhynchoides TaxID=125765 RepID=UPI003A996AD2